VKKSVAAVFDTVIGDRTKLKGTKRRVMSRNLKFHRGKISRSALSLAKHHIKRVPQAFWPGLGQPEREAGYSSGIYEKEFSLETPLKGSSWMNKNTEWGKSHLTLNV
jgi:hypothetical protein